MTRKDFVVCRRIDTFTFTKHRRYTEGYWRASGTQQKSHYTPHGGQARAVRALRAGEGMVRRSKEEWADKLVVYARRSAQADIDKNVRGAVNFAELGSGPSV